MKLKFITGNSNKFKEIQNVLEPFQLEQVVLDLDEIQDMDEVKIIEHKAKQALQNVKTPFFVEDTSFSFECFDYKFPGPFIKFFEVHYKASGLFILAKNLGRLKARGKTIITFVDESHNLHHFEGNHQGQLVEPRGDKDFGYGAAFIPDRSNLTFGEMERSEKYKYSARAEATRKFREFLIQNNYEQS